MCFTKNREQSMQFRQNLQSKEIVYRSPKQEKRQEITQEHQGEKSLLKRSTFTKRQFNCAEKEVRDILSKKENLDELYAPSSPVRRTSKFNKQIGDYKESHKTYYFQIGKLEKSIVLLGRVKLCQGFIPMRRSCKRLMKVSA